MNGGLMDQSHETDFADTGPQGRRPNTLTPQDFDGLPMERPMDSGDTWGAPPDPKKPNQRSRYDRELAVRAWDYLAQHDADRPLPSWVTDYLRKVAVAIKADIGPRGSLSPASAHAALRIVGEQWPEHHPESVYAIIQGWIDASVVNGRKAGAVRYIEEHMDGDRSVLVETVVEWYRKGQKLRKAAPDRPPTDEEFLGSQHKNSPTRVIVRPRR
jgi:hypothetical protein